jgi:hypothetical protein
MLGHVEFATREAVTGWLFDPVSRQSPPIRLSVNGIDVAATIPDLPRPDVSAVTRSSGAHGFCIALRPAWLRPGGNRIVVRLADSGVVVPNGEHEIVAESLPDPGAATGKRMDPLPGVPWIESPFFDGFFEDADASMARVARELWRDGYSVIDFPEPEFAPISADIKVSLQSQFDWEKWRTLGHGAGEGMRLQDAWRDNEGVRALAANPAVANLLSRLYGRVARPFQTLNFPVGTQQHFHSDCVHFSSVPERYMCAVWVALEDIGADQGPLVVYPGTHRWPVYVNEHIGLCAAESASPVTQAAFEPLWRELVRKADIAPQRFLARKGQALIWTANLLHGGLPHLRADLTRWSQVTHYFFDDCAYVTPMHSDPAYGSTWYRRPVDIATGKPLQNRYAGYPVPTEHMEAVHPRAHALPSEFDSERYLVANPDVRASELSPAEHWLRYGRFEGRAIAP